MRAIDMQKGGFAVAAFTRRYSEEREEGSMRFTFYCDICRGAYVAPAIQMARTRGLFQKSRERRACRTAFDEAQVSAKEHFNRCVQCGRWVCDEDFRPDYGLCVACDHEDHDSLRMNDVHGHSGVVEGREPDEDEQEKG